MSDLQTFPKTAVPADEPAKEHVIRYPGFGKIFLLWTTIGVLTSLRYYFYMPLIPGIRELALLIAGVSLYYPWVLLTPLVFRLESKYPLGTGRRNLALLAIWSVPICLLASPLMLGSFIGVMFAFQAPLPRPHLEIPWYKEVPVAQFIFWAVAAGGYFIRTLFQLREQERTTARLALEKSQLEAGLNQAQLEALRARLNPHFLFNSLQNISVMARQDGQTTSRMLTRLGDLLRAVLRQDSQPESTLREEVELTRAYVALEQMRFGDRLQVDFEIAPEVQLAMVPCFLLQPLIENAIVHGLRGARKTGIVTVGAVHQDGKLILSVTDNGVGPPTENPALLKTGIGLQSTSERLSRMYPNGHTFSMRKLAEGGAEVLITIPLRFAQDDDGSYDDDEQTEVTDR
ncbi:MAG: sensor histidine kinase [Acidobacteriota bacterium]